MEREKLHNYIKEKLENYLLQKGINTRSAFRCLNPDHHDTSPTMIYDVHRNKAHCLKCGVDYDIFDLIGIDYKLDNTGDIFSMACQIYNLFPDEEPQAYEEKSPEEIEQQLAREQEAVADYIERTHSNAGRTNYFRLRGLSQATIDRFTLGYDPAYRPTDKQVETWRAIVIPNSSYGYVVRNTNSQAKETDRYRRKGGNPLYNAAALQSGKPVFVVEGELDALSVSEAGAEAVALGSNANVYQLVRAVQKQAPANILLLALDNDKDGRETTDKLKQNLTALGVPFLEVNILGTYKDPNMRLVYERSAFVQAVQDAQEEFVAQDEAERQAEQVAYLQHSPAAHLANFPAGLLENGHANHIATGFERLDECLEGGLYKGLYIIGATNSLGKTTFLLQLADQIAQQGKDVLIFSLKLSRTEIMAKSISRLTFLQGPDNKLAKTARSILSTKRYAACSQEERELLNTAIASYGEYAGHIYIPEDIGEIGAGAIQEMVQKHIRFAGSKPVVLLDSLELLTPLDLQKRHTTDKSSINNSVLELKRLSRQYKIPVIAISNFASRGYNDAVTLDSFKETGVDEGTDVLLGLQARGAGWSGFDMNEAKRKNPREVELIILKNRNGRIGDTVVYNYYPIYNLFEEQARGR